MSEGGEGWMPSLSARVVRRFAVATLSCRQGLLSGRLDCSGCTTDCQLDVCVRDVCLMSAE